MKNSNTMIFGSILLGGILLFSLYGIGNGVASSNYEHRDDDDDSHYEDREYSGNRNYNPVTNKIYTEECGSCHMAYPAQLLPPESWTKMMDNLEDHFGESAELDDETRNNIGNYLVYSATPQQGSYRKMLRNTGSNAPLRITQLPYFVHEHDEIPSRFIKGNDKVGSLSQCNACHKGADKGSFDEDNIFIPGVGRWDD